ncbi:MAG TPA: hypothetical protein VEX68_27525 [Bryobacteraceae bacterium]|nr:hypothetical protein [Bryobacteraceae bacterium]
MSARWVGLALLVLICSTRFAHVDLLWIEEAYPMAAAAEVLRGKMLYRDIWFDKPPLYALFYVLFGATPGWPLRIAGAAYILLACYTAWYFLRHLAGKTEAALGALLLAFALTFDIPSSVMALAPDLLALPLHIAAIGFAMQRRSFLAGLAAGIALLFNTKALLILLTCLLWTRDLRLLTGFLIPNAIAMVILAATGSLHQYWEQVWVWGTRYSADTFIENPWREGIIRTLNWAGFHAAIVVGSIVWLWKKFSWQYAAWMVIAFASVCAGLRFFPRYYFHLLPVFIFAGAQGLPLLKPRWRVIIICSLLMIPLLRFGPRFISLATGDRDWSDLTLMQDSQQAAEIVRAAARPGSRLLVWGYRPDIFVFSGLPSATRFLDSQPLNGVMADRHLMSSTPTAIDIATRNQQELEGVVPDIIVDGIGMLNPNLAAEQFPPLRLQNYSIAGRTRLSIIYITKR